MSTVSHWKHLNINLENICMFRISLFFSFISKTFFIITGMTWTCLLVFYQLRLSFHRLLLIIFLLLFILVHCLFVINSKCIVLYIVILVLSSSLFSYLALPSKFIPIVSLQSIFLFNRSQLAEGYEILLCLYPHCIEPVPDYVTKISFVKWSPSTPQANK